MPSNKILEQKKAYVAELTEKIGRAKSGVLVKYEGITVADDTELRKKLREAGVEYTVIKNSLIGRACDAAGYGEIKSELEGMNALAISFDDPVVPAKILREYADKIKNFEIRAGFVEGKYIDKKGTEALADIPSYETLIAKFLGSIQSPLYNFAYALQAIIDKEGKPEAEAPAAE
jgi:large subunit ribosomal protein L10